MNENLPTLWTIGHSTHSWEIFLGLLDVHSIACVVDVRSQPWSRMAHFRREALQAALPAAGRSYVFLGRELGARRDEPEAYRDDRVSFERVARLPEFQRGLQQLLEMARDRRLALMCAEKEPLDCHRTILIARQLRQRARIEHILADGTLEPHPQTEQRLVQRMGIERTLFEPDLSDEELIARAYESRSGEVAYRREIANAR